MKFNQWTMGLAAVGVVSLASAVRAEEAQEPVMTALSSTVLSGYVDTSAIWQFGTGNALVGRSFDGPAKQDGFNLNVVKVQLEKPLDEGQFAAGYNVGLLFGPDANTIGTTSGIIGAGAADFAVKNAYVHLRAPVGNGIDIKMGVWDTPCGYEVFESGNNPNYSRSFGYALEPITHTGVLATYQVNDMISVLAGVANNGAVNNINARTFNVGGENAETQKSYMAGLSLTAPESAGFLNGATLYSVVMDHSTGVGDDILQLYVGATLPTPIEALKLGAAYDYRAYGPTPGQTWLPSQIALPAPAIASSYANAVAGYVTYQVTENLKFNNRLEYATGSRGTWYTTAAADKNNQLLGYTATVDYALWANTITRVEFRWDRELHGQGVFNDGTDKNALSLALNVIYKF